MHELFVYGTLICEDIMHAVAGPCRRVSAATLGDHRRLAVKGERYPGVVKAEGYTVDGVLYTGIARAGLRHLDRFEGGMYRRVMVRVVLAGGGKRNAFTYVVKDAFRDRLEAWEWDLDQFLRAGKRDFERRYVGFKRT